MRNAVCSCTFPLYGQTPTHHLPTDGMLAKRLIGTSFQSPILQLHHHAQSRPFFLLILHHPTLSSGITPGHFFFDTK